jgi:hypothetical protein
MGAPPLTLPVVAHAALFASWFVIFLVQAMLVATGRVALHRRSDGLALMLLMIGDVVGLAVFVDLAQCRVASDCELADRLKGPPLNPMRTTSRHPAER